MATIINNPGGGNGTDNSAAWIIGIIVLVIIILLAIFFWPRISGQNPASTNTNVTVPAGSTGGTNPGNVYNTTINASTSNSTSTINGTTTLP
jgi:hypothetical protein